MNKIISTLILAAGKGTRMKSDLVKVLHPLRGKPLLTYSLDVARAVGSKKIVVVVGHQADLVRERFKNQRLFLLNRSNSWERVTRFFRRKTILMATGGRS